MCAKHNCATHVVEWHFIVLCDIYCVWHFIVYLCTCVLVFLCTCVLVCSMKNCPHPLFKHGELWQTWHTFIVVLSQSWQMKHVKLLFLPLFNAFLMKISVRYICYISNWSFLDWFNLLWKILNWRKTSGERHVCRTQRFSDKHKYKIWNGGSFPCLWNLKKKVLGDFSGFLGEFCFAFPSFNLLWVAVYTICR